MANLNDLPNPRQSRKKVQIKTGTTVGVDTSQNIVYALMG